MPRPPVKCSTASRTTYCCIVDSTRALHFAYVDGINTLFDLFARYPNKWPIYIRSGRIITATVDFLMKQHGMSDATDVIITGGSSGGMATYLNCDRIADQIKATNSKIRVTCLADAGMFLDHPGIDGNPTLSPQFIESFYAWNASSMTNQGCIAHYTPLGTPWKCIFSQYVFHHGATWVECS